MRITDRMMANSMQYWLGKQREKLNDISTVVASGQQINKPSDDPSGTAEIMSDRVTISACGQYDSNIEQAQTWVDTSNTTLEAVSSLLSDAQELISSFSSDDTSADYADQIESIYEQVISYANSLYGSDYMYSGDNSTTAAFANSTTISAGTADSIVFDLAAAASTVTINVIDSEGNVVRTLTTTGISGTNTLTWNGCDNSSTLLADGSYSFTVTATDASGCAVASYPSYRGDAGGKVVTIGKNSTVTLNNDGGDLFSDALKVLSEIITTLEDTTSGSTVSVSDYKTALSETISGIQDQQTALATTTAQLTNATDRLDALTTELESRVADLLLADTDEAAAELTAQETAYETTVETASSILKMSTLKDYL